MVSNELTVQYITPTITSNFELLNAKVNEKLEIYRDVTINIEDEEAVKSAKRDAAALNDMFKDIDERRKAVKREYLKPLEEFESQCKSITNNIMECRQGIKTQLDEAEAIRRDKRRDELETLYEEFAPLLVPVVPFSRILDKSWLNKTTTPKKASDELTAKVVAISQDWETLKSLNLEYADQAEVVFFNTLSLQEAINANKKMTEEANRIDELKAMIEPEPAQRDEINLEEVYPYTMFIDEATPEQIKQLGEFAKSIGIHGKFKRGAF